MKNTFLSIIALLLFISVVTSCKKVNENGTEENEINKILDEDNSSSFDVTYDKSEEDINDDSVSEDEEELEEELADPYMETTSTTADDDIDKMKRLLLAGEFKQVADINFVNSDEGKYYTGIAYYSLMKQKKRYANNERIRYRDKAISLLKEVSQQKINPSLRARALLWYAMALHLNYSDIRSKRVALDALLSIQRELQDTEVYDDSFVIAGIIYSKMGWFVQARRHYRELTRISSYDGRVWDPENQSYYLPQDASEIGLEKVRKLCYP